MQIVITLSGTPSSRDRLFKPAKSSGSIERLSARFIRKPRADFNLPPTSRGSLNMPNLASKENAIRSCRTTFGWAQREKVLKTPTEWVHLCRLNKIGQGRERTKTHHLLRVYQKTLDRFHHGMMAPVVPRCHGAGQVTWCGPAMDYSTDRWTVSSGIANLVFLLCLGDIGEDKHNHAGTMKMTGYRKHVYLKAHAQRKDWWRRGIPPSLLDFRKKPLPRKC